MAGEQARQRDPLVVAISSRALFDLTESHRIFEEQGLAAYREHQIAQENEPLKPGAAFNLVKKLLRLNEDLGHREVPGQPAVEVILLSRNSHDTGLRIFNSIEHYELSITRAAFCSGESPYRYARPFDSHLFLSLDGADVRRALERGIAAATILSSGPSKESGDDLKIAFDGDAVLFSDEAEKIYKEEGLTGFNNNERHAAREPLEGGPFKPFLAALQQIQMAFPEGKAPIRTCLITARQSDTAYARVARTLRAWNIRIDDSLFLGGKPKPFFLDEFEADIYFDDRREFCDAASDLVATGHVPYGVRNQS